MDEGAFFESLDQNIAKHKQSEADKAKKEEATEDATRKAIGQVRPLLESYKVALEKRGIDVKLSIAGRGCDLLTFELMYHHSGHHGFRIEGGGITKLFSENGKSYTASAGGPSMRGDQIDMAAFETFIQSIIQEFMVHAPKNGGYLKQ
jgi:hypothetical protein